jgi:hypothetical protein
MYFRDRTGPLVVEVERVQAASVEVDGVGRRYRE